MVTALAVWRARRRVAPLLLRAIGGPQQRGRGEGRHRGQGRGRGERVAAEDDDGLAEAEPEEQGSGVPMGIPTVASSDVVPDTESEIQMEAQSR